MTTSNKKITIQDIVNEGKKPIQLKLDIGIVDYIRPSGAEVNTLEKDANKQIVILREQQRTLGVQIDELELQDKKTLILTDMMLWKGLNKVNDSVTLTQVNDMPFETKNQMNMQINIRQLQNIDKEQVGELKNLRQVMKDKQ